LPHDVLAYALRSRSWHYLDIDQIQNIDATKKRNESGFEELVMNEKHKELVLALVESHHSESRAITAETNPDISMDLVQGKGKGLIILLHGVPGVGKTSTAETVAAYTQKPLYPITCGDVGEKAIEVEANLERHFQLAHKWGCVLLLDEADVFLAKRDNKDVKRNAIVSVFLRTLEWYSGILFLTTNRVGVIDEAFRSRIQIQLYYPNLDKASTLRIWENSLKMIQRKNENLEVKIGFNRKEILDYSAQHFDENKLEGSNERSITSWNGRQIRNAFQTAIALAQYDRLRNIKNAIIDEHLTEEEARKKYKTATLKQTHFSHVAALNKEYYDYVRLTNQGLNDDEVAGQEGTRAPSTPMSTPSAGIRKLRQQRLASPSAQGRRFKQSVSGDIDAE
ncbi:P-loop containing nucleoside triphosphate hydrolase protein, partial [Saccharata proteae CBS 121410]